MPAPSPIRANGTLVHRTGRRTWTVVMPNGFQTLGHIPERALAGLLDLTPGEKVALELTAYDFSMARIAGRAAPARNDNP